MYTKCTDQEVKLQIVAAFTQPSCLRIVCTTVAFGLGIDCPDVRQVIHFGSADDTEGYIQETDVLGEVENRLLHCY